MKKFILYNFWLILALAIVAFFIYFYFYSFGQNKVCLNGNCFFVELAVSDAQREKGLMFRNSMPADKGMFFIFDKEEYHFMWMKNTKIPLDMIFIDKDLKIVYVAENVAPCIVDQCPVISAPKKSFYILEINVGLAKIQKLAAGQTVQLFFKK